MSSDVAYFTQDYWINSLATGHPLVYHSSASSKNTLGNAPTMDDTYVMQWNTMDQAKYETNLYISFSQRYYMHMHYKLFLVCLCT